MDNVTRAAQTHAHCLFGGADDFDAGTQAAVFDRHPDQPQIDDRLARNYEEQNGQQQREGLQPFVFDARMAQPVKESRGRKPVHAEVPSLKLSPDEAWAASRLRDPARASISRSRSRSSASSSSDSASLRQGSIACWIRLRNFGPSRFLFSLPSFANEITPVSSETTTTNASLSSVTPIAARWRVPSSREINGFCVSGRKQQAAATRLLLMTTAPSCSGVCVLKIVTRRS